jgi:PBP4 family serine-type D-alanyl-D-alanine carboxypeptidase
MIAMGGAESLQAYVNALLPVEDARNVELVDGSGMSHSNPVSPQAMYALLEALSRSPDFGVLWRALPIAGVDGTLAKRMRGTAAEGVLRAKTGTLSGSYNLAGYVPRFNAAGAITGYVPFVVLTRTTGDLRYNALAAHNRVGARLAALVNQ